MLYVGARLTEFRIDRMGFRPTFTENTSVYVASIHIKTLLALVMRAYTEAATYSTSCLLAWFSSFLPILSSSTWTSCNFYSDIRNTFKADPH